MAYIAGLGARVVVHMMCILCLHFGIFLGIQQFNGPQSKLHTVQLQSDGLELDASAGASGFDSTVRGA